ncbi:MAG: hypothetical protein LRY52_10790 [Sulfurospirillum cavolei]|nr:hypothetical protein [Sulfurospirillum cavolei]
MENTIEKKPITQKVEVTTPNTTSIYNEDNLFIGEINETNEPKREFEPWYKVKIQGLVKSFKVHEDGSLQLKFEYKINKSIGGIDFVDLEDKSIRLRKENGIYTTKEAQNFLGKTVEIIDVSESPVYVKKADGTYDFGKIERYLYQANNVKVIEKTIESGFELYKIVEFKVKEVIPNIKYDMRKKAQVVDKEKSILIYEVENDTLVSLHKIIVNGLTFQQAQTLKGKEVVVLDLAQVGKNYVCSKIKIK